MKLTEAKKELKTKWLFMFISPNFFASGSTLVPSSSSEPIRTCL